LIVLVTRGYLWGIIFAAVIILYVDTKLEVMIGERLREQGLSLAVAESCTGGLIGHRLTNVPGSSMYYMGSITAYAYQVKVSLLGVKWETLETHGAVSDETVGEMAQGVRQAMGSDIGLSVSGIAGPKGGTPEKPVGLVHFGLSSSEGIWTANKVFNGNRLDVKEQAADFALKFLKDYLEGKLNGAD
jgi:PncC family amidohydrolase